MSFYNVLGATRIHVQTEQKQNLQTNLPSVFTWSQKLNGSVSLGLGGETEKQKKGFRCDRVPSNVT